MATAPFKLNRTQFDKIAKRFVSSSVTQRDLAIPYLLGDHIIASNSSSAVLIRRKKLNHPCIPMAENASTKAMLENSIKHLFTNFETDITLVVNKGSIQQLIKFLKEVRRNYKKSVVEITFQGNRLTFRVKHLDNSIESFIQERTVECESMESSLYNDEHFTVAMDINHLINAMLTLRESDTQSTLNFNIDSIKPMLFENTTLQIILMPIKLK